jgi:hypothetical protein
MWIAITKLSINDLPASFMNSHAKTFSDHCPGDNPHFLTSSAETEIVVNVPPEIVIEKVALSMIFSISKDLRQVRVMN